jgi:hypothetical protein
LAARAFLPGRVIEIRLHGRRRATEALGDLRDRQTLGVAVVARERNRAPALDDTVIDR